LIVLRGEDKRLDPFCGKDCWNGHMGGNFTPEQDNYPMIGRFTKRENVG